MANLGGSVQVAGQDLYTSSTIQQHGLGDKTFSSDGRTFRYVQAGGTLLVAGNLLQSPASVANHKTMTPSAAAVGDMTVTFTLGAAAVTANQYANGYLVVDTTPGNGYAYLIKGHPAASSSASLTVTLAEPIQVALTTSSRVTLQANPYAGVIQMPTTASGAVVGVCVFPLPANSYGWIQTGGYASVLVQGTPAIGAAVMPSTGTNGAVTTATAGTPVVGNMTTLGVNGLNHGCKLLLD